MIPVSEGVESTVGKRRKCWLPPFFSFSYNVFKSILFQGRLKFGLYGKGLKRLLNPLFIREWLRYLMIKDLIHSLTHHFETIPNSKKLQTTIEMWPLKGFQDTYCIENIVVKGEMAHFEQFHLFPQCLSKAFFFLQCVKMSIYGGKG